MLPHVPGTTLAAGDRLAKRSGLYCSASDPQIAVDILTLKMAAISSSQIIDREKRRRTDEENGPLRNNNTFDGTTVAASNRGAEGDDSRFGGLAKGTGCRRVEA